MSSPVIPAPPAKPDPLAKPAPSSRTTKVAIKAGILLAITAIIVVIVLGSGYIAKLMMKASSCNETMILLVTAGVLTAVVFMGLGYLLFFTQCGQGYIKTGLEQLTAEEQYRYYRRQSDLLKV